jgi:hypothetical protein
MSPPQDQTMPSDLEVAVFLLREGRQLSDQEREFVDDMILHLKRQLTLKQRQYLHSLFRKLGGEIT